MKQYVGVTTRLRRRMWEHKRANTPFGKALRKYGEDNFKIRLLTFDTIDEAYDLESKLVTEETLNSCWAYNQCEGGKHKALNKVRNPMLKLKNRIKRSNLMKTDFNPMSKVEHKLTHLQACNTPEYKKVQRDLTLEALKDPVRYAAAVKGLKVANDNRANKVLCDNVCFYTVADAAAYCGITRSSLRDRIRSSNVKFKNFLYIN